MTPATDDTTAQREDVQPATHSLDADEVEKFNALAAEWWDPEGKFRPLHQINPPRLHFIRDRVCAHFNRNPHDMSPLHGLNIVDIGCGGGLLCEPLARLGAHVTGIDPGEANIKTAEAHMAKSGIKIDYQATSAEQLITTNARFDIVLSMEVIEHVQNPSAFIATCADLVNPGGMLFAATISRTTKSFALAIIGAEYILRWLPRGTHQWRKFLRPDELGAMMNSAGLVTTDRAGIVYNPFTDEWRLSADLDVNYVLAASKPGAVS